MTDKIDGAAMWDQRFKSPDYVFGTEPNAFLAANYSQLPAGGRVLAVADGEGRNGVFLASKGFDVVSLDISAEGIAKAKKLAAKRGVQLDFRLADLTDYDWPDGEFDAVAAIFIQFAGPDLRRRIFDGFARVLRPGGVLLMQGYRPEQLEYGTGGPPVAENMYTEAMLRDDFADWEIELLASHDSEIQEGAGHGGMSALIDLVARKPE